MEERRGESISETMKKVGSISKSADTVLMADMSRKSEFFTKAEAIQAAQKGCDEHGIDPTDDPQERITRYIDIMHGSPHTEVEKNRMNEYKLKVSNESAFDAFTIRSGKAVNDNVLQLLIDESKKDPFLGDIASTKKTDSFKVFYVGDEAVGFAIPRKDSDGRYRTGAIYVLPQYRNKGYASQFTKSYFKDKKGRAFIEPDNTGSANLFTSTGFKKSGKQLKDTDGVIYNEWLLG